MSPRSVGSCEQDPSWFAGVLSAQSHKQCIVYKAAPCVESEESFRHWLSDSVERDGHTAVNIVGAPSSSGELGHAACWQLRTWLTRALSSSSSICPPLRTPTGLPWCLTAGGARHDGCVPIWASSSRSLGVYKGPSTKRACQIAAEWPGVKFGCVCIAERHTAKGSEHLVLDRKSEWGAEWFITQGMQLKLIDFVAALTTPHVRRTCHTPYGGKAGPCTKTTRKCLGMRGSFRRGLGSVIFYF